MNFVSAILNFQNLTYLFKLFLLVPLLNQPNKIKNHLRIINLPMSSQAIVTVMAKHDFSFVFLGQVTNTEIKIVIIKVIMQGKLFQKCTHLLYCSVLSLGGNVNTRQMSQPCHSLTWDPSFT